MKVTLNWLKQYVDFNWSPAELTTRLTLLGLEVEGVHKISGAFDGIVVAHVVTRDKHPNADKLSLCRVNDGTGERQIVCGAQNFKAGDKVLLILPDPPCRSNPVKASRVRSRWEKSAGWNPTACCARPRNWACRTRWTAF